MIDRAPIGRNVHANGIRQHYIHFPGDFSGNAGTVVIVPGITSPAVTWTFVARHDQAKLPEIARGLDLEGVDTVVLSACVQMPALSVVPRVEALLGRPVVTAAVATTYAMLRALDLEPVAPGAAALLSGAY